ncbi:MAG: hypothetical protein RL077_2628 [Verrucomicrobiota bacterium]
MENGLDFVGTRVGVDQVNRLDSVECRRRCIEPLGDRRIG